MATNRARRRLIASGAAAAGSVVVAAAATQSRLIPRGFLRQMKDDWSRDIQPPFAFPNPSQWPDTGIHAAWLGHSTVLLKIDGYTILTDPVLGPRCGVAVGPVTLGLKRLTAPALSKKELPKIDLVLVSHAHFDHLDTPSLKAVEGKQTDLVTAHGTIDLTRGGKYRTAQELRWGARAESGAATVTALEVNHWGARMRTDTWRGYNGYLIEVGRRRIVFAGDTADTDRFRAVGGADVVIMPIGAYDPWIRFHCNPEQAWRMSNEARAGVVLPVHHQTFQLGREGFFEPIDRLREAAGGAARDRVGWTKVGQEFHAD